MDLFKREDLRELLAERQGPCVSVYVPTRRGEGEGNPIRWRKCLTRAAEGLVEHGMRPSEARDFLRPAHDLLDNKPFWEEGGSGLAFFLAEGFEAKYRLPVAFPEKVAVARHFHILPLLPVAGGTGTFYVLALSQKAVRLLRGTRDTVSQVELPEVPKNLDQAMGADDDNKVASFHMRPSGGGRGTWGAIFHGHGAGLEDHKDEVLRYFQQISHGLSQVLRDERAPLVVATVEYLHPLFQRACGYPGLWPEGIKGNPDRMGDKDLHQEAWKLVESSFRQPQENALANYRQLAGTGRTASGIEAAAAACRGEAGTLFVAVDRPIWGRIDPVTGELDVHEPAEAAPRGPGEVPPGVEDLTNLAAVHTLRHDGEVYVLPAAELPSGSEVAGIFWLPLAKHARGVVG